MGGKMDVIKGRIKEAVGALTDNNKLRDQGKADQTVGKVKQVTQSAVGKVKVAAKQTVVAAKNTARQAVNVAKNAAKRSVDTAKSATNSMRGRSR
jgi:uncharacterized protein YjbJ (UPF0337 family)